LPSGKRHYRVTLLDVYLAHATALQTGGLQGILDAGRIEAAIARPYSGYHRTIAAKAAVLFEAVANNHGFMDGNKRTALILADLLIKRSGYRLVSATARENLNSAFEALAVSVASGELNTGQIVDWFRQRIVPGPGPRQK
jgi:death-on-curing protein